VFADTSEGERRMNWMQRAMARKYEGSEDGFTLIELLVVILILGILSAIVVVSISGFSNTGKKQACISTGKSAESAAAAFYADSGTNTWPATIKELYPKYLKSDPTANADWGSKLAGAYDGAGNVDTGVC
jgi:prepilin-type N-terminal cleavage/methylation domain-containing protein